MLQNEPDRAYYGWVSEGASEGGVHGVNKFMLAGWESCQEIERTSLNEMARISKQLSPCN